MTDDMRSLEALTRILLDAELAKLRHLSAETRQRQDAAAELGAALVARSDALKASDPLSDLAWQTGQDSRWQAWTARTRKYLMREAAEIASQREVQLKAARKAFGRAEALAAIRRRDEEDRKLQAARRARSDP